MKPLLPPVKSKDSGKICVVIDLDETLVHSSFKVGKSKSAVNYKVFFLYLIKYKGLQYTKLCHHEVFNNKNHFISFGSDSDISITAAKGQTQTCFFSKPNRHSRCFRFR